MNQESRKSYSQVGQDRYILLFFAIVPAQSKFFVDVGAFNGINYSNTRLLYEHGWTGICIEPCSKNFAKLKALYRDSDVITERVAISDYEGVADLNVATIPGSEGWGSDVSCLDESQIHRWPDYHWSNERVTVTTLNSVLAKHDVRSIDLLAIDTEGEDPRVLQGIDLGTYKPTALSTMICQIIPIKVNYLQ